MKFNETACRATGIPIEHAEVFQKVANDWQSVIMSRAVGPACTGLIKAGYASKAFHVKAKSCDWGPMAGFLLADYRLTKKKKGIDEKGWKDQKKAIDGPMNEKFCTTTPLLIPDGRLKYVLFDDGGKKISKTQSTDKAITQGNFAGKERFDVEAESPDGDTFKFTLVKSNEKAKKSNELLWGVYFAKNTEDSVKQEDKSKDNTGLIPVRAIVNAQGKVPKDVKNDKLADRYKANSGWVEGYRGACTGDYDLFAVLPLNPDKQKQVKKKGNIPFEKKGIDIRPVKLGIREKKDLKLLKGEHPDYGNMTARIYMIRDNLNERFQKADGWTDRIMVHHSDEGGRPFWPEIDYPLHAFIPLSDDRRHYAIENQADLVVFLKDIYKLGYQIVMPPNWERELGEDLKAAHVPYTVPTWTRDILKRADLVRKEAMAQSLADAFAEPKPLALLNGMKVLFDESVPVQPVHLVPKDKPSLKV